MFEETIRALKTLGDEASIVSISTDDGDYFDRECPSPECLAQFKVLMEDWKGKVRDEEVFCPFCGHIADAQKWWTQEQLNHVRDVALAKVQATLGGALRLDAQRFNQNQPKGGFVSMSMKIDSRPQHVPIPMQRQNPCDSRSRAENADVDMPLLELRISVLLAGKTLLSLSSISRHKVFGSR